MRGCSSGRPTRTISRTSRPTRRDSTTCTSHRYRDRRGGGAVTFLANVFGGSLSWSPDGAYLTLGTTQRTEPGQVVRVDLVPRTPKFHEDQFRDLFKEETPKPASEPPRPATAEVTKQEQPA